MVAVIKIKDLRCAKSITEIGAKSSAKGKRKSCVTRLVHSAIYVSNDESESRMTRQCVKPKAEHTTKLER